MTVLSLRPFAAVILAVLLTAVGASAQSLPAGWATRDIGGVGAAGSATLAGDVFTVRGSGSDVWNSADEFRYVYTQMTGDATIVTRVASIENVNAWVKAGVMMRETLDANSKHAFMLVSPGKGLAFQRRASTGGESTHTAGAGAKDPYWVRLTRVGSTFTAEQSVDGLTWKTVGTQAITMTPTIYVGLAVSSHVDAQLAQATFANTAITLPGGWQTTDVGAVGAAGSAASSGGVMTIAGSGADVWNTADEFRFVYQPFTGDGSIVTRVTSIKNVDVWVKAGVMMRESLSAGARHAFMLVSPGKGLAFQRRKAANGDSVHTDGGAGTSPAYVKLTRQGTTFTAYRSADGGTWTKVGSETISMGATIYVGLAVSSHRDGTLADATFASTALSADASAPTVPPVQQAPVTAPPPPAPEPTAPAPVDPEPAQADATTLKVLHWNLHHGNDPNNKWAFPRQLDVIYNANVDIISLNEVEKFTSYGNIDMAAEIVKHLAAKTGKTWYQYMVPGTGASTGIGNAIISRFPLSGQNVCRLSSERNAVHATMTVNGRTFNFWSTHLAVETGSQRVAEVGLLLPCMSSYAQARVVAGDFNAGTGTTEINNMVSGHIDAWAKASSLGLTSNYSGNCDGCTRNSRIDYMFISKEASTLTLKKAEMIDTRNSSGVMASDHKPMIVTFEVR